MIYIISLYGLVLMGLSYYIFKNIINPIVILIAWYTIWCIASTTGLWGLIEAKNGGAEYILSNVYVIATVFLIIISIKSKKVTYKLKLGECKIPKIFKGIRIGVFCLECLIILNLINVIRLGIVAPDNIRGVIFTEGLREIIFLNTTIYTIFFQYVKGFVIFDVTYTLCSVIRGEEKVQKLQVINFIMYCLIIFARIEIMRLGILILILFISYKSKISKKKKKKIFKIFIILSVVVVIVTILRGGNENNIFITSFKSIYVDFTGAVIAFDNYFNLYGNGLNLIEGNILHILFGGIIQILNTILGLDIMNFNSILTEYADLAIVIGENQNFNAFYTMYYNFLSSSNYIIPYIVSGLLGAILGGLYKLNKRHQNNITCWFYIFFFQIVIFGSIRWEFSAFWIWTSFICGIVIFINSLKISKNNL